MLLKPVLHCEKRKEKNRKPYKKVICIFQGWILLQRTPCLVRPIFCTLSLIETKSCLNFFQEYLKGQGRKLRGSVILLDVARSVSCFNLNQKAIELNNESHIWVTTYLQFWTILLCTRMHVTKERTYINKTFALIGSVPPYKGLLVITPWITYPSKGLNKNNMGSNEQLTTYFLN